MPQHFLRTNLGVNLQLCFTHIGHLASHMRSPFPNQSWPHGTEFYFLVQVCDDVFQCLYFEKHYISYPGPIGGIGFCCSCGCIAGDLESGVRFFWCLSNRSRPSSSHHIESKPEEENSKIQHLKKYILK